MEAAGSVAYAVVIHCLNGDNCPSYGLYRSTNWFSSWVEEPAPDSGKFNAAGGIDLSAFGSDVWILVGNGVSQLKLFGSTNEGRSFEKLVAPFAISCGTTPFTARVLWISCSTGMQVAFFSLHRRRSTLDPSTDLRLRHRRDRTVAGVRFNGVLPARDHRGEAGVLQDD